MGKKLLTMARRSIALAASFIIIISGFNVFAADSETSDNSDENTAVEALTDTTGDNTVDSAGIQTQTVSVLSADELLADTIISSDEETGIAQLANIIPDLNLRTEVWRSLAVADQLGDPADPQYTGLKGDELYKAVLQNFTGTVYASGYVKVIRYHYSFQWRLDEGLPPTEVSGDADTRDEAVNDMNALIAQYENSGAIIDTESVQITSTVTITENKKPDEELIENIEGIQWLRKAEKIDISSNKITSLEVLDYDKIKELQAEVDGDPDNEDNGMNWFGSEPVNTSIDFSRNPIIKFPTCIAGALLTGSTLQNIFDFSEVEEFVKLGDSISINIPVITRNDVPIQFTPPRVTSSIKGIDSSSESDYQIVDHTISLGNIKSSGDITVSTGNSSENVGIYTYNDITKALFLDNLGFTLEINKRFRVLNEVVPDTPDVIINLHKSVSGYDDSTFVPGATYGLYKEGSTSSMESGMTDGAGNIIFENIELEPGNYYVQEVEPPDGYNNNTEKYSFTVGKVEIKGGQVEGDKVYIDRYSPPITLELIEEPVNMTLTGVNVSYTDYEGSKITKEFGSLSDTQDFINKNKGNETDAGIFYGEISVLPIFTTDISAKDEQKTIDFSFKKYGKDEKDEQEIELGLEGAEFTLKCMHSHANEAGFCTDLHSQSAGPGGSNPDSGECDWSRSKTSNGDGVIVFEDLVVGEYKLTETKAPDGYVKPSGYWIIKVSDPGENNELEISIIKGIDVPAFEKDPDNSDNEYSYKLQNLRVPDIPTMGGQGTFIFTAGGILLMGCAIILFINLKKSGRIRR